MSLSHWTVSNFNYLRSNLKLRRHLQNYRIQTWSRCLWVFVKFDQPLEIPLKINQYLFRCQKYSSIICYWKFLQNWNLHLFCQIKMLYIRFFRDRENELFVYFLFWKSFKNSHWKIVIKTVKSITTAVEDDQSFSLWPPIILQLPNCHYLIFEESIFHLNFSFLIFPDPFFAISRLSIQLF